MRTPSDIARAQLRTAFLVACACILVPAASSTEIIAQCPAPAAGMTPVRNAIPFRVIAHRGFSARFRDNSPAAVKAAVESGADFIEIDVRSSGDGVLVAFHDAILPTGQAVSETTAAELSELQVSSLRDLLWIVGGQAGIVLDLKRGDQSFLESAVSLMSELDQRGVVRDTVLGIHTVAETRMLTDLEISWSILGLLRRSENAQAFFSAGGDILRLRETEIAGTDPDLMESRAQSIWVTPGIALLDERVGDISAGRLDRLMQLGLGGVLTNDPEIAVTQRMQFFCMN